MIFRFDEFKKSIRIKKGQISRRKYGWKEKRHGRKRRSG